MAKTITIGCKLPHGLILEHPANPKIKVTLKGRFTPLNETFIDGGYSSNEIDADFFEAWKNANKEYPALVNGAIFEAKSAADLSAVAKEMANEKTGFEALDPKNHGVKTAD